MVDYLRLSIIDKCNFQCLYCSPFGGKDFFSYDEVLQYEEMKQLVKIFIAAGIRKVRITGGEPLLKKNILDLIKKLRQLEGLEELSLTTNGFNLHKMAQPLRQAGIDRINISLDSLNPECFKRITGVNAFFHVWEGIQHSLQVGFDSVKLNVVPMKTINDGEILEFAKLTKDYPLNVRFIELFYTNENLKRCLSLRIPNEEVEERINHFFGWMQPVDGVVGNGPAQYFKINGAKGVLGFISSYSQNFCGNCSRIRVDCTGKISPCLFAGHIYDTKKLLRKIGNEEKLLKDIRQVILKKAYYSKGHGKRKEIEMCRLGG